jgi:hypothetical protein
LKIRYNNEIYGLYDTDVVTKIKLRRLMGGLIAGGIVLEHQGKSYKEKYMEIKQERTQKGRYTNDLTRDSTTLLGMA